MTSNSINGAVSTLSETQLAEVKPYLLKGVKTTADCKRLGNGSFGVVDELYVQGTLCAAKQLHGILLDHRNKGADRIISHFVVECRIMSSVRHPNIVQFLGLHMLPNSPYPSLVMEQLPMSLEDLLDDASEKKEELPLSLKLSVLSDTAKGLIYLHNHDPQIIHRDLTSRNVLLTLAMQAKITDLGNALIIDSHTVAQTMTQTPGTAVYMPPEAIQAPAMYDSTIDMFSYGHLALYVIIQEFPRDLLSATFMDPITRELRARSEIQRREKYINTLQQKMGKANILSHVINRCLDNMPDERPSAMQVLENLEEFSKIIKTSTGTDDTYLEYQQANKLDLIRIIGHVHRSKSRAESVTSPSPYVISSLYNKAEEYLEVVEDPPPQTGGSASLDKSQQIKIGVPSKLVLTKTNRTGSIRRGRGNVNRKEYTFKVASSDMKTSLVYYEEKTKGEINLDDVTKVSNSPLDGTSDYSFTISVKGKEGPFKLIASSMDDRDSWVKALEELTSSSANPQQITMSSQKLGGLQSPPYTGKDATMYPNRAYGFLPPTVKTPPTVSSTPHTAGAVKHDFSESNVVKQTPSLCTNEASTSEDLSDTGTYYYIKDPVPMSTSQSPPVDCMHGNNVTRSAALTKSVSCSTSTEDEYTQMEAAGYLNPMTSHPILSSPESPTGVSNTLKRLSRFNPRQMEHLIEMLKVTFVDHPQSKSSVAVDIQEAKTTQKVTVSQQPPETTGNGSASLEESAASNQKFRERPSQLGLVTSGCGDIDTDGNVEQSVYSTIANEESIVKGDDPDKEVGRLSVPTLVVEPTHDQDEDLGQPQQRRKSTGLLTTTAKANAIKFKLARLLSDSDRKPNTSLLVTGDSPDTYEDRPDWAKASTGTTPVHSPLPRDDPLSLLRQGALFIQRSTLKDLEEIGEGQFGKVYKATLSRARSEKMTVAVKTIKKYKSEQETSDFFHEMGVMMNLMHPNIIHLYGIVEQETPWLVLQYLPNRDLKNYLIKNERNVDQLINYMIDVAMGMHYIMERGLVHRDLAARNVMVDSRETCKVADFGLLREIPKDNTIYQATTEMPWPIRWMAPESLDNREFSPASDVWSFGVLLWEMYYPNQLPYAELNNVQVPMKVHLGHRLSIPTAYPSTVASIMKACWQKKPEKRPSFLLISTLLTNMTLQLDNDT